MKKGNSNYIVMMVAIVAIVGIFMIISQSNIPIPEEDNSVGGATNSPEYCGNSICDSSETETSCWQDCRKSFDSAADFSSIQGKYGWSYEYFDETSYKQMSYNSLENKWKGPYQSLVISNVRQHPEKFQSVRAWTAPRSGTLQVDTNLQGDTRECSSGITAYARLNQNDMYKQLIKAGDKSTYSNSFKANVDKGDKVYFVVDQYGNVNCDSTSFMAKISYSASVASNPPSLTTLAGDSTAIGSIIILYGLGFTPIGNKINFAWSTDPKTILTTIENVESKDGVTLSFAIPSALRSGMHVVSVSNANGLSNTLYLSVSIPPVISSLSPSSGSAGTEVTIRGSGFEIERLYRVYFNSKPISYWKATDESTLKFKVPSLAAGTYPVYVVRDHSDLYSNKVPFTISGTSSKISLTSFSGSPKVGSAVTLYGIGFTPTGNKINFASPTSPNKILTTIDNTKSKDGITLSFTVPPLSGMHVVSVSNANGNSNTIYLLVVMPPVISSLSPSSGPAGTEVMIKGSGFKIGNYYNVYFNKNKIALIKSTDGSTLKFKVPSLAAGTYPVYVGEDHTNLYSNMAPFTIT